jgi:hypothetical protein
VANSVGVAGRRPLSLQSNPPQRGWNIDDVAPPAVGQLTLRAVMSPEEVSKCLDAVEGLKHGVILTACNAAGLRIFETIRPPEKSDDAQRLYTFLTQSDPSC